jgi:hypothetical protein
MPVSIARGWPLLAGPCHSTRGRLIVRRDVVGGRLLKFFMGLLLSLTTWRLQRMEAGKIPSHGFAI